MNKDVDYILASKAFGAAGKRGPFPVDGMVAEAELRHFNRAVAVAIIFVLLLSVLMFVVYVFRPQINEVMGLYKIPIEIKTPDDMIRK